MRRSFDGKGSQLATFILRLGLGIDLGMHGLMRIPKLGKFADKMVGDFSATILPELLVRGFALALPFVELAVGILLLIGGRFLVWGAFLGGLVMSALIFGTSLREEWMTLVTQLVHLLAFYVLLRESDR